MFYLFSGQSDRVPVCVPQPRPGRRRAVSAGGPGGSVHEGHRRVSAGSVSVSVSVSISDSVTISLSYETGHHGTDPLWYRPIMVQTHYGTLAIARLLRINFVIVK